MSTRGEHDGRLAIVTGASSGIGRAIASDLARTGALVLAVGRDASRLTQLAAEQPGIVPHPASVADPEGCAAIVSAARALAPPVLLVNCAGLGGYLDKPIFEHTTGGWRTLMAVNLDAAFELSRHVANDIRAAGFGRIIMISSTAGEVGAPAMSGYCASKHGMIGLMRSIAHDIAPYGATCNAVLPSWVRTPMAEQDAVEEAGRRGLSVDSIWRERAEQNPAGRIVTPQEVADVVTYLASSRSSGINGQAVTVSIGALW